MTLERLGQRDVGCINTTFVNPDLVEGTLRRSYDILRTLTTPTQRGAFVAFVVAEVTPSTTGTAAWPGR